MTHKPESNEKASPFPHTGFTLEHVLREGKYKYPQGTYTKEAFSKIGISINADFSHHLSGVFKTAEGIGIPEPPILLLRSIFDEHPRLRSLIEQDFLLPFRAFRNRTAPDISGKESVVMRDKKAKIMRRIIEAMSLPFPIVQIRQAIYKYLVPDEKEIINGFDNPDPDLSQISRRAVGRDFFSKWECDKRQKEEGTWSEEVKLFIQERRKEYIKILIEDRLNAIYANWFDVLFTGESHPVSTEASHSLADPDVDTIRQQTRDKF